MVSYAASTSGLTFNLTTGIQTGIAIGDVLTSIEVIQGSAYADYLTGDISTNIFMGAAGADSIDGAGGSDSAWYLTSSAGVQIDLLAGTSAGGDADGDVLTSIENGIGSGHDDTISGDGLANKLEGGDGNDTISGGDGNDTIYGGVGSSIGTIVTFGKAAQADMIHGGNGHDFIRTPTFDAGAIAYGDAGNDTIIVSFGTAHGDDTLTGNYSGYELFGDSGDDEFFMAGTGSAYGGEDGDAYRIDSSGLVTVKDDGTFGTDYVYLSNIATTADVELVRSGDHLIVTTVGDWSDGSADSGGLLEDWFAGVNTIEWFATADGTHFQIPA